MASLCAAVQRPGQEQCRRGWAGVHFVGRTLVAGAASAAPRDDAHARCPSAGAAMIAIGRCARCVFRGGPSGRIAIRRGRTEPLSQFRGTENDFDCS